MAAETLPPLDLRARGLAGDSFLRGSEKESNSESVSESSRPGTGASDVRSTEMYQALSARVMGNERQAAPPSGSRTARGSRDGPRGDRLRTSSQSELATLRRVNVDLFQELRTVQQTPREEVLKVMEVEHKVGAVSVLRTQFGRLRAEVQSKQALLQTMVARVEAESVEGELVESATLPSRGSTPGSRLATPASAFQRRDRGAKAPDTGPTFLSQKSRRKSIKASIDAGDYRMDKVIGDTATLVRSTVQMVDTSDRPISVGKEVKVDLSSWPDNTFEVVTLPKAVQVAMCESVEKKMEATELDLYTCIVHNKTLEQIQKRLEADREGMEADYSDMKATILDIDARTRQTTMDMKRCRYEKLETYKKVTALHLDLEYLLSQRGELMDVHSEKLEGESSLVQYMVQRDHQRHDIKFDYEDGGDMSAMDEEELMHSVLKNKNRRMKVKQTVYAEGNNLGRLEAGFKQLIEKSGETDLFNLCQRITSLDEMRTAVVQQMEDCEDKEATLNRELDLSKQQLSDLQTHGLDLQFRRAQLDVVGEDIKAAERVLEGKKELLGQGSAMLSALSLGLQNLANKVMPVKNLPSSSSEARSLPLRERSGTAKRETPPLDAMASSSSLGPASSAATAEDPPAPKPEASAESVPKPEERKPDTVGRVEQMGQEMEDLLSQIESKLLAMLTYINTPKTTSPSTTWSKLKVGRKSSIFTGLSGLAQRTALSALGVTPEAPTVTIEKPAESPPVAATADGGEAAAGGEAKDGADRKPSEAASESGEGRESRISQDAGTAEDSGDDAAASRSGGGASSASSARRSGARLPHHPGGRPHGMSLRTARLSVAAKHVSGAANNNLRVPLDAHSESPEGLTDEEEAEEEVNYLALRSPSGQSGGGGHEAGQDVEDTEGMRLWMKEQTAAAERVRQGIDVPKKKPSKRKTLIQVASGIPSDGSDSGTGQSRGSTSKKAGVGGKGPESKRRGSNTSGQISPGDRRPSVQA